MPDRPFSAGIAELKRIVGSGTLTASVTVDQVYASSQHEGGWISGPNAGKRIRNHPRGGDKNFLGGPIEERAETELHSWMSRAIGDRIPTIESARRFGDEVARGVDSARTPILYGNLRKSAAVTVTDDGAVVYHKPAAVPRLSREQLRALSRNRRRAF